MMIRAIAVDDEPLALEVIKTFSEKIDFLELKHVFTSPSEAMAYLKENPVDLLLLDINMPSINGLDFFKSLEYQPMAIFTTAHSEYAVEGFNVKALDYLLKPFKFNRFMQAIEKAKEHLDYLNTVDPTNQYLYIRADYTTQKIFINDIAFIEGMDNYIKLHFDDKRPLLVRMSMKSIIEKLPANKFVRVHRSYIVPVSKISSVKNKVILIGNHEIPIGLNYHDQFQEVFGNKQ